MLTHFIGCYRSLLLFVILKVLRTPDFRNCKAATEIRQRKLPIKFILFDFLFEQLYEIHHQVTSNLIHTNHEIMYMLVHSLLFCFPDTNLIHHVKVLESVRNAWRFTALSL